MGKDNRCRGNNCQGSAWARMAEREATAPALLVADDVGNAVWRVSPAAHAPTASNYGAGLPAAP